MNDIKLSNDPLDVGAIYSGVLAPDCGAVSLFVGTTRDSFMDKPVLRLEYEAYESMAVKTLERLAAQLREKFQVRNIAIHHRLGEVPVCEASVVIAVASPHRQASLQAVSFAIDALKADVPIFKKELYADASSSAWKSNSELEVVTVKEGRDEEVKEELYSVDPELVQIAASANEISRRIESFQKRKRQEIDEYNVRVFCRVDPSERESSCARVDATLIRQKGSKSHLKVHRVENVVGPQTSNVSKEIRQVSAPQRGVPVQEGLQGGVAERLANAELFLGLSGGHQEGVFARLKAVEDRLLYLESLSPEYFSVGKENNSSSSLASMAATAETKRSLSAVDLGKKVLDLEKKLQAKFVS